MVFYLMPLFPRFCAAQKPKTIPFSAISGYRIKSNAISGKGFNFQLYARDEAFSSSFEKVPGAKTSSKLNFSLVSVIACIGEKTNNDARITLEKVIRKDGIMEVYFKSTSGEKLSAPRNPFGLYSIGIDRSMSGIDYYMNGKLVQELRN